MFLHLNFMTFGKQEFCDFMQEMLSMMDNVKDEVFFSLNSLKLVFDCGNIGAVEILGY